MNRSELVEFLNARGKRPKASLGQNFLVDANLAEILVAEANLDEGARVVEIGPGLGMITRKILARGVQLHAVEKDREIVAILGEQIPESGDRFTVLEGDAVRLPYAGLSEVDELTVIANPPFSITGPWLSKCLEKGLARCFSLLLQREAVDRLTASVNTRHFSPLTIRLEAAYDVTFRHRVPARCFYPAPRVESEIVVFKRKPDAHVFGMETLNIMKALFTRRRKQIGGGLRQQLDDSDCLRWEEILEANGLDLRARPEQIPTGVWIELDNFGPGVFRHSKR